jgi:hypothetical protein
MKNPNYKLFLLLALLVTQFGFSQKNQPKKYCGVIDSSQSQAFEDNIATIIESNRQPNNNGGRLDDPNGLIVIPVVFHILHHSSIPAQNVSKASLDMLLNITNNDLININQLQGTVNGNHPWIDRRGRMNIKLVRACIDPNGNYNPDDGGIVRKELPSPTTFQQVSVNTPGIHTTSLYPGVQLASLGGMDAWPSDKYLNIWVADIEVSGSALYPEQRLGDITFPYNGNNITVPRASIDGCIINYNCFPEGAEEPILNMEKSRIITHELGHWLGLRHLTGFDCITGDEVTDTPPQKFNPSGCPTFPLSDQGPEACPQSLVPGSNGIMFMNYMTTIFDYCKRLFTIGQVDRVRNFYFNVNNLGFVGNRGPFINNYFGIREPYILQNNILTVYLNNPVCLDVNYSFTGPVTEISHDNKKIVFSVPCPSAGNVTVTATAENYIDEYLFSFTNTSNCLTENWHKKYFWFDSDLIQPQILGQPSKVTKGKNGNNYFSFSSSKFDNNYNHTGPNPSINYGNFLIHFNSEGQTNWVRENLTDCYDIFIMENGNLRTKISSVSPNYIYLNGVTGAITNGPLFVPNDERIIAETNNGSCITYKNGILYLRTPTTTTSVQQSVVYSFFNKNTNRLFIQESIDGYYPSSGIVKAYEIVGNSLTQLLLGVSSLADQILYHVDKSDNIYTLDMQCGFTPLYKYDFQTGNYAPLYIPGFLNNYVLSFKTREGLDDSYTSNSCLVIKANSQGERETYYIDLQNSSVKSIQGTSNLIFSCFAAIGWGANNYIIDGDNIYMSGNILYDNDVTVGNQTITPLPPNVFRRYTNFLLKTNLQSDYNKQVLNFPNFERVENRLNIRVSPVPANNELLIEILRNNNPFEEQDLYSISILDRMGNVIIERKAMSHKIHQTISGLDPGVYVVMVLNKKGEKASKIFIKQ